MSDDTSEYYRGHVEGEGHSVAGWTGVTIIIVGAIVVLIGLWVHSLEHTWIVAWIGAALIVLGVIAWPVLDRLGFGPKDE